MIIKTKTSSILAGLAIGILVAFPITHANDSPPENSEKASNVSGGKAKDKDPTKRLKLSRAYIEKVYGPVLEGIDANATAKKKLIDVLVDRHEALKDVDEILVDRKTWTNDERTSARRNASNKAQQDIGTLVEEKARSKLAEMMEVEYELAQVANGYAPSLNKAGVPLNPEQMLKLASAMHSVYNPKANSQAAKRSELKLDKWGLNELDQDFISRLDGVLSIDQRALVQNALVFTNRGASK